MRRPAGRGWAAFAAALALACCSVTSASGGDRSGEGGVSLLGARARCAFEDPTLVEVDFRWELRDESLRDRPIRLELALRADQLGGGRDSFHVDLPPGAEAHRYRGRLFGETVYHWRVAGPAAGDAPAFASGTGSFTAPSCATRDRAGEGKVGGSPP